jgi:peroxiredoxin
VALCPQRPEFLKQMVEKHGLSFDILRDEGNGYAEKLGLRYMLPDYLREVYLGFPLDLARLNGEDSWSLPIPARLVINRDGVVSAADYDTDYRFRPEPEKTLEDLDKIA